jgi:hypothetical protein
MAHPHDRARVRPKRSRRHSWDADDPGRDRWLHEHVDTAWNSSGPACRRTWAPSPTCHRSSPTPRRSCTAWPLRAVGTGRPPGFVWTIDLDDQPVTKAAWTGWWPSRGRSRPVSGSVDTDPTTEAHRRIGPRPRSRTPRSKPPRSGVGGGATTCGWRLGPVTPKERGPRPTWCSASRRQRAWEQRRAAASGLSAVEVDRGHVYDRDTGHTARELDDLVGALERRDRASQARHPRQR